VSKIADIVEDYSLKYLAKLISPTGGILLWRLRDIYQYSLGYSLVR